MVDIGQKERVWLVSGLFLPWLHKSSESGTLWSQIRKPTIETDFCSLWA